MEREVTLRDKGILVEALWGAVNDTSGSLATVAPLIRRVLETGAWKRRTHEDGQIYNNDTFLQFITRNPPIGCRWDPKNVEALIRDDAEVLALWRKATTASKGGDHRSQEYKATKTNGMNHTIDRPSRIDRKAILSRLSDERPDLFQRVIAKKLSANAATIEAGWRKQRTPLEMLRVDWGKANEAEREIFRKEIAK